MKSIMDMGAMRLDAQVIPVGEQLALPWDLREWFAPAVLRQWISEEIDSLDWNNPQLVEHLRGRPGFKPKPLFSLMVYAYATAAFESEEIARRFFAEAEYRSIGGPNVRWDARTFTRFRRENRGLLKWALVQIFKRAIRAKRGDFLLPAGVKRRLVGAAVTRLDLARQMDRGNDGL
ncbi:MAG TPA: transposase [Verrucomicrobiae bacterium]|nr:transposase [Verrucomicrobiae bacterium]